MSQGAPYDWLTDWKRRAPELYLIPFTFLKCQPTEGRHKVPHNQMGLSRSTLLSGPTHRSRDDFYGVLSFCLIRSRGLYSTPTVALVYVRQSIRTVDVLGLS